MLKFFRIPFAASGDRTAIPDAVDVNGNVSYTQGYGFDYQRQKTDPASKNIERDKQNSLFYEMTTAISELQAQGVPDFITSALNGGTPYEYDQNAVVRWTDGDLYLSLETANTATPADATKWALLPTPARIQQQTYVAAVAGGTGDALTAAFSPVFSAWSGQAFSVRLAAANTVVNPTISANGLAALPIVKGSNLPLVPGDLPGAGAWAQFKHDATLGKVVLLNPAAPVLSGDSGLVLLASGNVSAGAANLSIDMTAFTAYRNKKIILTDFLPDLSGVDLVSVFSNDGGASYAANTGDYQWAAANVTAGAAVSDTGNNNAGSIAIAVASGNAGNLSSYFEIELYDTTNSSKRTRAVINGTYFSTIGDLISRRGAAYRSASALTNAVRFLFGGGATISTGRWVLYGYRE